MTTTNKMATIKRSKLPPPVPAHWHWSDVKLTSKDDPFAFRAAIFAKAKEANVHISMKSLWWYVFESVTPRYVMAECRFFTDDSTSADINLLEGDRFAWAAISRHICGKSSGRLYKRPTAKPIRADKTLEALVEPWMSEDLFDLIGSDILPSKLLPVLLSAPPNIKRCTLRALYHCDRDIDDHLIQPYCQGGATFLEKRIQYWAKKIIQKNNRSFL